MEDNNAIDAQPSWTTSVYEYLNNRTLREDKIEARRLRAKATRYSIIRGLLYKRSFTGPYLRCLEPAEAKTVLREMHGGECGNHSGSRSLAHKATTVGYYWPTMRTDAKYLVRKCDKCQRFAQVNHLPPEPLHSTIAPWPFMKWGMNIVGPLSNSTNQKKYVLALTDYFTKWIEVEAFGQIRDHDVKRFVWKSIICKFGIPAEIVTDNGSRFISFDFQDFCKEWEIKLTFLTPRYPATN